MAKRTSVTTTTDQRLRAEFARRKNRRASITEQYVVPVAKSRRKEKLAQTRHYEFLLQHENLAAVQEIVGHVQQLAESEAQALGHVLSPMDKHRLHMWANKVTALTNQFVPSSSRETDPLRLLLEQLQALQEGHACLIEVAIEARQVVEKWERTGIFDDSKSSDEDEDGEEGDEEALNIDTLSPQQRALDWEREKRRKMEASYAYQRVRERAASHVIKRNTLRWVRSRAAFCSRVEELEVFGNTTAGLVEELTSISELQRQAALSSASKTNDIYDLVKDKKAAPRGHKMDFTDLMRFSKHLALFTVDHALRRVGEIENKRRLFQLRCLIKLQTWWRKMHEIVKGKRMLKLLEELRRKKEHEREAELQRQHELKALAVSAKIAEANSRKAAKAAAKSSKPANSTSGSSSGSSGASSSSRSVASPKADADTSTRSLTSSGTKANNRTGAQAKDGKSVMPTPPSTPKTTSMSSGGGASKPKKHSLAGASKDDKVDRISRAARVREARLRKEFEDELKRREREDEEAAQDTDDVEAAWKRFMESEQNAEPEQNSDAEDERGSTARSGASHGTDSRGMTSYTAADVDEDGVEEWKEWSDDEDRALSEQDSRVATPHSTVSSRLSTPRSNGVNTRPPSNDAPRTDSTRRSLPPSTVDVTTKKRPAPSRPPQTPTAPASVTDDDATRPRTQYQIDDGLVLPYAAAPSPSRRQLLFGTSQVRQSRPSLPGTGQLSKFMPFAEQAVERPRVITPPTVPIVSPRRHLHEIDFNQPAVVETSTGLDMFLMAQPLFEEPAITEDVHDPDTQTNTPVAAAKSVRVFSFVRANRVARVRTALEAKRIEAPTRPTSASDCTNLIPAEETDVSKNEDLNAPVPPAAPTGEAFVVFNNDVREALLRPIRGRASIVAAYISNPMLKLDFRKEDVLRKPDAVEPAEEEAASPETSAAEAETITSKVKFGSHIDWLHSMGLESVMEVAARGPNRSPAPGARPVKKKEYQAQLATAMLTLQESTNNRASQKRKKEHALPLLGRRSPKQKEATTKGPVIIAPAEQRPSPTLPPVVERKLPTMPSPPPRHHRSQLRRQSTRKPSNSVQVNTSPRADSSGEESSDSALGEDSDSDAESSYASDADSKSDEDNEGDELIDEAAQDPALESGSDDESDDVQSNTAEPGVENDHLLGTRSRKASRRRRSSERTTNQRKRSSLHEPRHVKERKQAKHKKNHKPEDKRDPTAPDGEAYEERSPTTEGPNHGKKKASGRFRPHMSSLLRRLVPKESRVSFDDRRLEDEDEDAFLGTFDGQRSPDDSDASEVGEAEDPERAAAFFKLYSQYMGLLNAAPPTLGIHR